MGEEGKKLLWLYESVCIKLLKIIKYYRIERIFHSIKRDLEKKTSVKLKKILLRTTVSSSNKFEN